MQHLLEVCRRWGIITHSLRRARISRVVLHLYVATSSLALLCRHLFEERKYVEEFCMQDVEAEMGIDQQALIRLALLLGSDYTEGIKGIGVVNAVEVVRT